MAPIMTTDADEAKEEAAAAAAAEEEEEAVLVDVRLEFMELIHLPGPCFEVVCVEELARAAGVYVGEHGSFFAIPVRTFV
jgi:hypothetical protein